MSNPRGALLVGSVPLSSSADVFRTAGEILGQHVKRIPDGETGERTNWIGFQVGVLSTNPALEFFPEGDREYTSLPYLRVRDGVDPATIRFENLGYADAALVSWEAFQRLQTEGAIPAGTRFQVSLPTPIATVAAFIHPTYQESVLPAYRQRMLEELDAICAAIPHDRLALQWDVAVEFGILEGAFPNYLGAEQREATLIDWLVTLGDQVPSDVELGYHLCYGDAGHKHFKEPDDTTLLVRVANALSERVQRSIEWIHLPVPRGRDDVAYYAPLKNLKLRPGTELYLGLVHLTDGEEGTRRRIAAAQSAVSEFGVATECGFGRRPAETVAPLMRVHAAVADPVAP
jgi:hypothetical protein